MDRQPRDSVAGPAAWGKADLHVHTRLSDGGPTPGQVVEHVLCRTDLDVVAITDHNRVEGGLWARDLARRHGLEVIVGEEVSTADGHLLALCIEEPIGAGLSMEETVAAVHAQGGLAIAAHPYDIISWGLLSPGSGRWTEQELLSLQLDGLETLNASLVRQAANARAARLAQRLGLASAGGSDAHHLTAIGRAYTCFPGHTAEDLRRAIANRTVRAAGQTWGWRQYAGWVPGCLIPRTIYRVRTAARVYGLA